MKNPDFEKTFKISLETMQQAIEISKVARLLNKAEWLVGWVPAGLVEVR